MASLSQRVESILVEHIPQPKSRALIRDDVVRAVQQGDRNEIRPALTKPRRLHIVHPLRLVNRLKALIPATEIP